MCLRLIGDLRALILIYSTSSAMKPPAQLMPTLNQLKNMVKNEIINLETMITTAEGMNFVIFF